MANTVTIEVDANTRNAEKDIGGLGGKIKNLAKPIAIGSAAATGLAAAAVKIGDEFKEAENTIRAGTGASGKDLDALKDSFNEVFANVPNDSQEVATAIADLNTELGLTGEDLTSAPPAFLNLSRTMGDDASGAIKSVSDSLVAFGEPATSVEEHLDKLTVASQAVGVPVSDLSSAVVKFAPQLKEMGLNLEESTALFANMEAAGLETSRMMPGLNTAMKKLTDAGMTDMSAGISELIDDIKSLRSGALKPDLKENITGNVEIREIFSISKIGKIAGCFVKEGNISRNSKIRLLRDNVVIHTGAINSLKRFKEEVKEVKTGYECGVMIENYSDIKVNDIIETFEVVESKRKL